MSVEQSEELEVLSSIYPLELEVLSAAPPVSIKIRLVPHAPGGEENHVGIVLLATFPPEYPGSAPPELTVEVEKGLGRRQKEDLEALADSTAASEGVGVPVIFTVCEALKEWLCDNNVAGQDGSMYSEMLRREQKKDTDQRRKDEKKAISLAADSELAKEAVDPEEEERIRRRQAGQPVTVESFNAWKAKFEEELALQANLFGTGAAVAGAAGGGEVRLSGKQLFLQNKANLHDGEDLVLLAESEEVPIVEEVKGKGKLTVFGEIDYDEDEEDEDWQPGEDDDEDDDEDDEDFEEEDR